MIYTNLNTITWFFFLFLFVLNANSSHQAILRLLQYVSLNSTIRLNSLSMETNGWNYIIACTEDHQHSKLTRFPNYICYILWKWRLIMDSWTLTSHYLDWSYYFFLRYDLLGSFLFQFTCCIKLLFNLIIN